MFGDAYAGRRVFVTGHTGFKGSWLTLWLTDLGAKVTGYSLGPPTEPSLFEAIGLGEMAQTGWFTDVRGDVRDMPRLQDALKAADPEIVLHLAAQPMVRRSYEEPRLTFDTNVMGTVNVLEAVRSLTGDGPRVVLNVTTDKCYENLETSRAYAETDPLGGHDPYSASKACSELVTRSYRRSYCTDPRLMAVATARAGNVLGGGDWGEDRILPDCMRALTAGRPIVVRNPEGVRPWQHVLDSLSGYLALSVALLRRTPGVGDDGTGAWNFGPRDDALVTVGEVVETVVQEWGTGAWVDGSGSGPHEAGLLVLDASKAGRHLGWKPAWDMHRAVAAAVRWYKAFGAGDGSQELIRLCRDDIASYRRAAADAGAIWALAEAAR